MDYGRIQELLYRLSSDIGTLILEYGVPPSRIWAWVTDTIEASRQLGEAKT